ncbi:MAG: MATE family efflux transporter [Pseudoflavonifractor sp.]
MTEKQFTALPVGRVFLKLAVPGIFSMLFSAIYMMADGVFVGRFIGAHALAAVNLVMPIMLIVFALSDMIAVGSAVKVSTALGEGREEKARGLFSASMLMILGLGLVFSLLGLVLTRPIIFAVIQDDLLAEQAYRYVRVFVSALPFIMPIFALDNFLRVCGKAKYSMWVNIIVSVLNIGLDWLFIAFLGLGIEFSALASVLSMFLGAICSLLPFFTKKITLHFAKPSLSLAEAVGIVYNGSSEFFSSIAGSFIATLLNGFLLTLGGALAVASYGVVMYIDTLLIGVLYGILDAIQPAVSYNLGAGEAGRSLAFFRIASLITALLSLLCMTGILLFPEALAGIFAQEGRGELVAMTVAALRLFAPSYLFTWFNMVTSAFLTAMDQPRASIIIMVFRAIVFPVGCLFGLTARMGVYGVFLTAAVSGGMTAVVALLVWRKYAKQLREKARG